MKLRNSGAGREHTGADAYRESYGEGFRSPHRFPFALRSQFCCLMCLGSYCQASQPASPPPPHVCQGAIQGWSRGGLRPRCLVLFWYICSKGLLKCYAVQQLTESGTQVHCLSPAPSLVRKSLISLGLRAAKLVVFWYFSGTSTWQPSRCIADFT